MTPVTSAGSAVWQSLILWIALMGFLKNLYSNQL